MAVKAASAGHDEDEAGGDEPLEVDTSPAQPVWTATESETPDKRVHPDILPSARRAQQLRLAHLSSLPSSSRQIF